MSRSIISEPDLYTPPKDETNGGDERLDYMYRDAGAGDEPTGGEQPSPGKEPEQIYISVPEEKAVDDYASRLVKYIPAEVVTLYITLDTILQSSTTDYETISWLIFGFGLIATYLYLWQVTKVRKKIQLLISVGAFFVWVFATGGPFELLSWYEPVYGGLLLPSYTFLVAIVKA